MWRAVIVDPMWFHPPPGTCICMGEEEWGFTWRRDQSTLVGCRLGLLYNKPQTRGWGEGTGLKTIEIYSLGFWRLDVQSQVSAGPGLLWSSKAGSILASSSLWQCQQSLVLLAGRCTTPVSVSVVTWGSPCPSLHRLPSVCVCLQLCFLYM